MDKEVLPDFTRSGSAPHSPLLLAERHIEGIFQATAWLQYCTWSCLELFSFPRQSCFPANAFWGDSAPEETSASKRAQWVVLLKLSRPNCQPPTSVTAGRGLTVASRPHHCLSGTGCTEGFEEELMFPSR